MKNGQKRKPERTVISLDAEYNNIEDFYNVLGGKSAENDVMEKLLVADIMGNLTEVQRKIIQLKIDGYDNKEVYLMLEIPSSSFYKEMQRIRITVENLIGEKI